MIFLLVYRCAGKIIGVWFFEFWGGPFSISQIQAFRMLIRTEKSGRAGRNEEGEEEKEEHTQKSKEDREGTDQRWRAMG